MASTFTLLLFASAQSYCDNTDSMQLQAPMTLKGALEELERKFPGFGEKILKSSQIAVNLDYVDWTWDQREIKGAAVTIRPGDEVGIVPPVSAG